MEDLFPGEQSPSDNVIVSLSDPDRSICSSAAACNQKVFDMDGNPLSTAHLGNVDLTVGSIDANYMCNVLRKNTYAVVSGSCLDYLPVVCQLDCGKNHTITIFAFV